MFGIVIYGLWKLIVASEDAIFSVVEIDKNKMVPMSNTVIQDRLLENYGAYGIKIVMIGVVGAYAMERKNYDHRCYIKFSVSNFAKLIGKEEKYAIQIFKKTCSDLRTKEIPISGRLDGEEMTFISGILNTFAYSKNEKTLALKFEEHFVPHFMEMSGNFTQHELTYILNLDRLHTISFYRFLKMKIGKEFKHNIIPGKEYHYEIEDTLLRKFFECENKYTQRRDFRNKVLNKIAEEISKGTDLTIAFGQEGNSINHLISFTKKVADQEPKVVSMDAFKITNKITKERASTKTVGTSKKPHKNDLAAPSGDESHQGSDEHRVGQPMQLSSLLAQAKAQEKKTTFTSEELDTVTLKFLSENGQLNHIVSSLVNKNLTSKHKSEKEFVKYVLGVYQQRHGSVELLEIMKNKIHIFEKLFNNHLEQQKTFGLSSIQEMFELFA